MIKEITTKKDWNAVLEKVDTYDFYHTYDYHQISHDPTREVPLLITYIKDNIIIALPVLLRAIPNSPYFDITSVYGYSGPIGKNIDAKFDNSDFNQKLNHYFISKKVVSVFSRLHPYISEQESILSNIGNLTSLGRVVNIDITLPVEESRKAYQKSLKNQVNKLRRTCNIRKAESEKDILEFASIYHENMKRLNASEHYFFKPEYFLKFMNQNDFKTDILLIEDIESKNTIAGSMFIKTKNFVQFHLSGTKTDYLRLKPSKLFLDEMRIEATQQNYEYFNLGGGLGSNEDSLFEFKSSFSKDFRTFKVWKHIVNQKAYDELVTLNVVAKEKGYFPLYRAI